MIRAIGLFASSDPRVEYFSIVSEQSQVGYKT